MATSSVVTPIGQRPVDRWNEVAHANHDPTLSIRIPAKGPSNRATGYGNHFVELVLAMLRQGADVRVYPYFCEPPLPPEFLACLMEPWDFEAEVGICVANPMRLERIAKHTIGITTWETTRIPPSEFRRSIAQIDELIVPCEDNIALFKELVPDIPCVYSPEGVDPDFWSPRPRDWDAKPLKICMFGALTYRKGVDLGIEAFTNLYPNSPDVELHVATSFYDLPQFRWLDGVFDNVFVHQVGWHTREWIREFYYDMHALFAPFRGEGFFLPGAEFMGTGGILIAPCEMGVKSYHKSDTGWVIPAHYAPVEHWGEHHGRDAGRFGEWLAYESSDVEDTLRSFVESSSTEKQHRAECAADQIPFLVSWDRHAQDVIDHVFAAYRGNAVPS